MFKTPACANDDRIVQFSEILHITIVTARGGLRLGSSKRVSPDRVSPAVELTKTTTKPLVMETLS